MLVVLCCSRWCSSCMSQKWNSAIRNNGMRSSFVWNTVILWMKPLVNWSRYLVRMPASSSKAQCKNFVHVMKELCVGNLTYTKMSGKLSVSLYAPNTTKITDYTKNTSNKSCWELNFLQKTQWAHMSISSRRARSLQRLPCFKYYNVLKRGK